MARWSNLVGWPRDFVCFLHITELCDYENIKAIEAWQQVKDDRNDEFRVTHRLAAMETPLAKCREKILYKPGHDKENFPSDSAPTIYGYFPPAVCHPCTQYSCAHMFWQTDTTD